MLCAIRKCVLDLIWLVFEFVLGPMTFAVGRGGKTSVREAVVIQHLLVFARVVAPHAENTTCLLWRVRFQLVYMSAQCFFEHQDVKLNPRVCFVDVVFFLADVGLESEHSLVRHALVRTLGKGQFGWSSMWLTRPPRSVATRMKKLPDHHSGLEGSCCR